MPGCIQYWQNHKVKYFPHGNIEGFQPVVLERHFHGIKDDYEEISEEFRLFHNLYFDAKTNKYFKIKDDGLEHEVIRIGSDRICIRTIELKEFLAVKEMRLGIFFDVRQSHKSETGRQQPFPADLRTEKQDDLIFTATIADDLMRNGFFIRILGKKLIKGFSKKDSGIWPYKKEESGPFTEFIIGVDDHGKEITLPCDPHGGNYLTPVCFRAEVLNRYYDNPSKYSVEDGYLRCGYLWGVQIDNDNVGYVSVFLGDIGRDIPQNEHGYWRSFNIVPSGGLSQTAFKRSFLSQFTDPSRKDHLFKQKFFSLESEWSKKHDWTLFKPLAEGDLHCLASLRIPSSSEQPEFDSQIMYLTKFFVDSLNEEGIEKRIAIAENAKGIDKLEEFLKSIDLPDYKTHIKLFRDLQSLRSTGSAHRKGRNYEKTAQKLGLNEKDKRVVFMELLDRAISFLEAMRTFCKTITNTSPP